MENQKRLLRGLMNVRYPRSISRQFIEVQDAYLQNLLAEKHITNLSDLSELQKDIYADIGELLLTL